MKFSGLVLLCCLSVTLAFPYEPEVEELAAPFEDTVYVADPVYYEPEQLEHRVRRQTQVVGGGGGSRKKGVDVSVDARKPVWKSDSGTHQVDVTAGYSQHLGGRYGSSRPDYRGGVVYTRRF